MKNTFSVKMSFLVVAIFTGIVIQGCGSITIKSEGGVATMYKADKEITGSMTQNQHDPYAYSDTSIVSILDTGDSTVISRGHYRMEPYWRSAFVRRDEESRGFVWCTDSTVNVITRYYAYGSGYDYPAPDTLCLIGRRFDNSTGQFLGERELLRVVGANREKRYNFTLSADNSRMLLFLYDDYEEAGEDEEVWNAGLFVLRTDMTEEQKAQVGIVVSEDYADDYNPALTVDNNGTVFYTFTKEVSNTFVQQSVVRLDMLQKRTDTLTTFFSRVVPYYWTTVEAEPHQPLLQALSGDTVLLAWPYLNGKDIKIVTVSKLDFHSKSFVFNDTLVFDEETCKYLIDDDEMSHSRLEHCVALSSGETILVLQQTAKVSGGELSDFKRTGPIVVLKLAANGAVEWQSSILKKADCSLHEDYFSYHVTDSSFCLLYRNTDTDDGIVFSEFMLMDGRSR